MRKIGIIALAILFSFAAQAQLKLNNDKSSMTIDGTSNIHDWTENVGEMTGSITATLAGSTLKSISALNVSIKVKSISSGKSAMDKNTFEALKADKHPTILFTLKSVSVTGNKAKLTGTLKIAGVSKTVTVNSNYSAGSGAIVLTGEHTLNMTDYNVEPPTALMGTVSTGEKVTLKFKLYFSK